VATTPIRERKGIYGKGSASGPLPPPATLPIAWPIILRDY